MQTNDHGPPSTARETPSEAAGGSVRGCRHSFDFIRDVVQTTINNHPRDCVFTTSAVDAAVAEIMAHSVGDRELLTTTIERAIKNQELYCPHESINRLPNIEETNG